MWIELALSTLKDARFYIQVHAGNFVTMYMYIVVVQGAHNFTMLLYIQLNWYMEKCKEYQFSA